jgi:hypothetical protein
MKRCVGFFIFILNSFPGVGQNQFTEQLQKEFYDYQTNHLQEKLFVHTDKTFYLAGETIWFKIYSVDESFHRPLPVSSIAYIELISKEDKPVMQVKVRMKGGTGNGFLSLPGSIPSGNYLFRAYTAWMKNFPPDYYYHQTLTVVNTLRGKSPADSSGHAMAEIQFFPEGGNLVNGLNSTIGFKISDRAGNGIDGKGAIVNQQKDTIVRFESFHNGMGRFQLTPQRSETYYAVLNAGDSMITRKLPDASSEGLAMQLSQQEMGKIKISVHGSEKFANSRVYLFAHTRHRIKNVQTAKLDKGEAVFFVNKKELGDGISTFTLFNESGQPACERLFFKRPAENLLIGVKADRENYIPRSQVHIDLATKDSSGAPAIANMSLSVFLLDSLQSIPKENIISYLYLSSDLKGRIEDPEYYFTHKGAESDEAIDNLLLTQGWRRFKWNDVFKYPKPAFEFLPETEGPVIYGKLVHKTTGLPAQNISYNLTVPGPDFAFCNATSHQNGSILFTFKNTYGNNALILQPANPADSDYRIDIKGAYADKYAPFPLSDLSISRVYENSLLRRSIGNQVENAYATGLKHQFIKNTISDSTAFYGRPDLLYYLDNYTRFVTMEEVLREYVGDVRVRKEGNKFRFRVRNLLFNTFFDDDPLILLDGLPVHDASRIVALDPLKIRKIEVVSHKFFTGPAIVEGIVSVQSYDGAQGATQLDPDAFVLEYDGLQRQREFYSPVYAAEDQQQSPVPDYRNVLLWLPNLNSGQDGRKQISFYTSDMKGKFAVVVEGISPGGFPGSAVTTFEVGSPAK